MNAPPRLLCYGGTGNVERIRLGAWPEVGEGALFDREGLPSGEDRIQFGCAVLGGRPALLYRERQNEESRGGYAFSLFLDPGDDAWGRFGWNAALLLGALCDAEGTLRTDLRTTPEQLSHGQLARLVSEIEAGHAEADTRAFGGDFAAAWIGVASCDDAGPFTLAGLAEEVPVTPAAFARLLAALPASLRTGRGWLAGGSAANALAFGCSIVVSPSGPPPPVPGRNVLVRGANVLEAMTGIDCGDDLAKPLAELTEIPVIFWSERFGGPVGAISGRLLLAYRLGRSEPLDDDATLDLEHVLHGQDALSKAVTGIAVRRLAEGRASGDPGLNRTLAGAWLDRALNLFDASAALLDPAALRSALVERSIEPGDSRVSGLLDLDGRAEVWLSLASREVARKRIPELARRAAADIATTPGSKTARTAAVRRVLESAMARSIALRGDMTDWEELKSDPAIGAWVREKTRSGSLSGPPGAEVDPHWLVRSPRATLADAEEEAPAAFLELLSGGEPFLDDGRRATARRLSHEAAARADVVAAFTEAIPGPAGGDPRASTFARRFARDPVAIEPLLAAAGGDTARGVVALFATASPAEFEVVARSLWRSAHASFRQGGSAPSPMLTTALLELLESPAGAALRHRIGTSLYGPDAEWVATILPKMLAHLRSTRAPGPANAGRERA